MLSTILLAFPHAVHCSVTYLEECGITLMEF